MKRRYTYLVVALFAGLIVYSKTSELLEFYVAVGIMIGYGVIVEVFHAVLEKAEDSLKQNIDDNKKVAESET